MWKTRILLVVVLLIPPGFIGVLYLMVRRAEAEGNERWQNIDPITLVHPHTQIALERGEKIFRQNCGLCHGKVGQGGLGKPLDDPGLLGEAGFKHIVRTVYYGVPDTPMTSWKTTLGPEDMAAVAAYIQYVANPKTNLDADTIETSPAP